MAGSPSPWAARSTSATASSKATTSPDQDAFHRRATGRAEAQASLVDFCNPNTPRAPPRDRPILAELRARPRVTAASPLRDSSGVLRPRARPGESAATANRGFTGQGPPAFAEAPQPDPLGHLLSRERRSAGRRLRPCMRSHRGPHHPGFREEDRDPPHPRCLPSTMPARPWQLRRSVTARGRESALEGPTLTGAPELSTACHQDVEKTGCLHGIPALFLRSRTFRCP